MTGSTDLTQQIHRVRHKLVERGANLGARLAEEEIAAFQQQHGITLPEAYRLFLLEVGNGGDGPACCGCVPLGQPADDLSPSQRRAWTELANVARPFPFTKPWVWEGGDESDEGDWEHVAYGSIYLGGDGCSQYWHLIVTGPERGHVWQFCREGILPTVPKRDFLQWYEDWLDGHDNWWA